MDRLSMLAKELRDYKAETDDRFSRLEAALSAKPAPEPVSPKKSGDQA